MRIIPESPQDEALAKGFAEYPRTVLLFLYALQEADKEGGDKKVVELHRYISAWRERDGKSKS